MELIPIISIGTILGIVTSLDLYLSQKRKWAFTRQVAYVLTVTLPAIYTSYFKNMSDEAVPEYNNSLQYVYPFFLVTALLTSFLVYLVIFKPLNKEIKSTALNVRFSFFDFLLNGYFEFKRRYDLEFQRQSIENYEIKKLSKELRESLPTFIHSIYTISNKVDDFEGYIGYVLYEFVHRFIGTADSRFTIRVLKNDQMETRFSTKKPEPGPIPVTKKKNLITKSMQEGIPLLYSRNRRDHFETGNKSIKRGVYDEYVSYCLMTTDDNKPALSICLDVKGLDASNRVRAFVDSGIFALICKPIKEKFVEEKEN